MPKTVKISLLAVSVVVVLGIFLGMGTFGVHAAGQAQEGAYKQINVYGEVLQHIQTEYVEVPNISTVTNGALRGLLESLDADSSYLTPADYAAYKAGKGGKAQIGLHVSKRFGYASIVAVVPGSPADRADLNDGDIIEAIGDSDGKLLDTHDLSLARIQTLLSGDPGSQLHLAVVRHHKADPEKMTLGRIVVTEPPVAETMYENSSILYLKPVSIDKEHVDQMTSKLKSEDKDGSKKILLDLRDVAAGDVPSAIRLASLFVKTGTLATLEGQTVPRQVFAADGKALAATAPLVVLVNRGTSGPAEIVAGAILDNKRGELVGERTFGEGSVQKTFDLADGGAVILSVAKYQSPSGKAFEDDAVTPGVLVASNLDDSAADDSSPDASRPPAKKPAVEVDDQLTKGLELLKAKSA